MTLKEISNALNTSIVPAIMGDDFTINPDCTNIVDLGTAISAMTADQFKSYLNEFCAAVRTYVDTRAYSPESLPLRVDSMEYGGIVQSIKSDFLETRDSHLYNLADGTVYSDVNKYFGTAFDNKVYEKDSSYGIAKSIPNTMYKKAFMSAEGVAQLTALIERWVTNTKRRSESALEHNLLSALAIQGKQIDLVTTYNNMLATSNVAQSAIDGTSGADQIALNAGKMVEVTSNNCIYNKFFMKWAAETIANITSAAKFANKKYNDGSVSTWLNKEEAVLVLNSIFRNRMTAENLSTPDGVSVYDTPFWNSQPDSAVPNIENSTHVLYTEDATNAEQNKEINFVVGLYYDRYAAGYTDTPIPVRTSYNADGDFFNQFHDYNTRYWIDTRNTAIVFTLL